MNILFVTDQLKLGGAERHLVTLATALAQRSHRVTVACMKDAADQAQPLVRELARGGVAAPLCCHAHAGLDLAALGRLARCIDAVKPDLVVAISQYALMCAALARLRSGQKAALVFICHSMGVVRRGARARLRFLLYRRFYRSATCVIFISDTQRAFFAGLGVQPARSEVVHNGVDLAQFDAGQAHARGAALRAGHGIGADELVIGLCAIFREEKRHGDLLAALARLRAGGVAARVVLVGDGPARAHIEACRDALGLGGVVLMAGFQSDVRPWIGMCDIMALTSHDENFPIATLECMALGKPLVASDVGAMREQVEHGINGLLYRAGDIGALAAALGLCADPALRAHLGQGALAAMHARFGVERMVDRYERIFDGVLPAAPTLPERPACPSKTSSIRS